MFVGDSGDPDASELVLEFNDEDSRVLAEMLGASTVIREIDRLQQSVAGLSIEWLRIPEGTPAVGRSIGDLEIRSSTGVTLVAALRRGEALPVPGLDFLIENGDTLVVVGRPEAIRRADALCTGDVDAATLLLELGAVLLALSLGARAAPHVRLSPIPLYLLIGLVFGEGGVFPWGTWTVNMVGSLLLGLLAGIAARRADPQLWQVAATAGFCGAFTTFSTFMYETVQLIERRAWWEAAWNLSSQVVGVAIAGCGWVLSALLTG